MELNKDIADISAAEAENFKGKRFILCYHDFNIKNFEKALVQIDKISAVTASRRLRPVSRFRRLSVLRVSRFTMRTLPRSGNTAF